MRKPTTKMIEALVDLFSHNGGAVYLPEHKAGTVAGLVERGLITPAGVNAGHRLTDAGLEWLIDNYHVVVAADGTRISGSVTRMTVDQVTAELTRFESDRALDAAALAKADAIRLARTFPIGAPVRRVLDGERGIVVAHHGSTLEVLPAGALGTVAGVPSAFELDTEAESDRVHEDANRAWANGVRAEVAERCDAPEHDAAAFEFDAAASERAGLGLIDATTMMLTEGRGSAITNLANGGHAWTPVDREGEFDQAVRRAPEAAWERPAVSAAQTTPEFPPGLRLRNPATGAAFEVIEHTYAVRLRNLHTQAVSAIPQDMARELDRVADDQEDPEELKVCQHGKHSDYCDHPDHARNAPAVAAGALFPDAATPAKLSALGFEVSDAPKPPVTGFLPSIDQALTPGEVALLDGVDTPEVSEGDWLAAVNGSNHAALRNLVDRGLAYGSDHSVHRHHYVTAVGAALVKYRRNIAASRARHAAQGNETPDRVSAYITRAFSTGPAAISDTQHASDLAKATGAVAVTVEQLRDEQMVSSTTDGPVPVTVDATQAARELISGDHNVRLTLRRLREGLYLTRADRVALADLLDTVRRAETSYGHSTAFGAWFDVSNTYRAHFGDPR